MKKPLGDDALNQIFREARTHGAWLDKPVNDEVLRQLTWLAWLHSLAHHHNNATFHFSLRSFPSFFRAVYSVAVNQ